MIEIRVMTGGDLDFGGRLSEHAGWNQTTADWRRFLALQPTGCFVAELEGQLVGTVTTCVFDQVGWIGMMLVDPAARRQGVGRALMKRSIEYLDSLEATSIRLDATPMGEPLYTSLGFKYQYRLSRFTGNPVLPKDFTSPEDSQSPDWQAIAAFDEVLTGYSREKLLNRFGKEPNVHAFVVQEGSEILGYACSRPGRLLPYVGPCMASSDATGELLLQQTLHQYSGQSIIMDVPNDNCQATEAVRSFGLKPVRDLVRMCRGEYVSESIGALWVSGGPEKG